MFLPALARDLYKSQQEVARLELLLEEAASVTTREEVKELLRQAISELGQLRKVMEGRKEYSRASQFKPKSIF